MSCYATLEVEHVTGDRSDSSVNIVLESFGMKDDVQGVLGLMMPDLVGCHLQRFSIDCSFRPYDTCFALTMKASRESIHITC